MKQEKRIYATGKDLREAIEALLSQYNNLTELDSDELKKIRDEAKGLYAATFSLIDNYALMGRMDEVSRVKLGQLHIRNFYFEANETWAIAKHGGRIINLSPVLLTECHADNGILEAEEQQIVRQAFNMALPLLMEKRLKMLLSVVKAADCKGVFIDGPQEVCRPLIEKLRGEIVEIWVPGPQGKDWEMKRLQ